MLALFVIYRLTLMHWSFCFFSFLLVIGFSYAFDVSFHGCRKKMCYFHANHSSSDIFLIIYHIYKYICIFFCHFYTVWIGFSLNVVACAIWSLSRSIYVCCFAWIASYVTRLRAAHIYPMIARHTVMKWIINYGMHQVHCEWLWLSGFKCNKQQQ